jgi:hypothetical protein
MVQKDIIDHIRLKDFRAINLLSIGAMALMVWGILYQLNKVPPSYGWAIADAIILVFNLGALIWSILSQRNVRIAEENLLKAMKDGKSRM